MGRLPAGFGPVERFSVSDIDATKPVVRRSLQLCVQIRMAFGVRLRSIALPRKTLLPFYDAVCLKTGRNRAKEGRLFGATYGAGQNEKSHRKRE